MGEIAHPTRFWDGRGAQVIEARASGACPWHPWAVRAGGVIERWAVGLTLFTLVLPA